MNILLFSYAFSPDVGGLETASALLATEFSALGHEVRVVTKTGASDGREWPFTVIRHPSRGRLLAETRWCDVFFQNNISLQSLWAGFLCMKPRVVAYQTWLTGVDGSVGWRDRLKRFLIRFTTNVAISKAVAEHIRVPSVIIGNPYRADVFKSIAGIARERDLVFVGRLVSDKGVDCLIEALGALRGQGIAPRLTIVGTGSEEPALRSLASARSVQDQIEFAGMKTGTELAAVLNAHRILVVPSRWAEPFGIVALEGIACGCAAVGSEGGGLGEAIGPCGLTFRNGSVEGLAEALRRVLADAGLRDSFAAHAGHHLAKFEIRNVASEYLKVFERVAR